MSHLPETCDPLGRLAALCGIQPAYHDNWGQIHHITDQTTRLFLQAMGLQVGSEEEIEESLSRQERLALCRVLPPVQVHHQDSGGMRIPLTLPADQLDRPVEWILEQEDRERHEGRVVPAGLEPLGELQVQGTALARLALSLPLSLPDGYHTLSLHGPGMGTGTSSPIAMRLIVAPPACYLPPVLQGQGRVWGLAVQLYGVRSGRNWGMGDFSDLGRLVEICAELGGDIVGLNPLHALFPETPTHDSPYCPSSRLALNVMYVDPEAVEDLAGCAQAGDLLRSDELQARLRAVRDSELVDYAGVARAKLPVLEACYGYFRMTHLEPGTSRGQAFLAFRQREGERLRLHALFEALQEHCLRQDPAAWGWQAWPEVFRDPGSPQVRAFAQEHAERVTFFEYLQWLAETQLEEAARRAARAGLAVGLYKDLAVSVDRFGAEVWANRELFAPGISVGAPPDALGPRGQNWGLPPMIPQRLAEAGYEPFTAILRRSMRHAGALRIDHVMGLMRLFWIPLGGTPADGAYVHYPLQDLLGIVALESQRNRCLVIGEDLGTVPDEVRQVLIPCGVLSYRVLYFERRSGDVPKDPGEYPAQALVTATTHDLPTLAGFWAGEDLQIRDRLQIYPSEEIRREMMEARVRDRTLLLEALKRQGLLPAGTGQDPAAIPELTDELVRALLLYLARSPARVMVVQLEDLLGVRDQANLPGTMDEHPNWKRRLPLPLEQLTADGRIPAAAELLRSERSSRRP